MGADVRYHDPFVAQWDVDGRVLTCVENLDDELANADLVVLVQAHSQYDLAALGALPTPLLDTRGVVTGPMVTRL